MKLTHIGGPTLLIEWGGKRILTDPTFDPPGRRYSFGWGAFSRKVAGPAVAASSVGLLDAILLTHDHHDDNLDAAGRALLPSAREVVTTVAGAKRLGANGLAPWGTLTLDGGVEVTATPCRHGPPGFHFIVGDVIGFALRFEGRTLWISGDTVLYEGVRSVAERIDVDVAVLHLGGVRFPVTGPLRYTLTARDAVELGGALNPRIVVPLHYEGWAHFREGRAAIEREFAAAPAAFRASVRWLELGEPAQV